MFFYDWTYIMILPAIILSIYAQAKCSSTFSKYSRIQNSRGLTGAEAARRVLASHGITNVTVEPVAGNLTDHFDPRTNVIRLSESVYNQTTVAAVGVACHEAGHAVQHAEGYVPNKLRAVLVPISRFGSSLAIPLLLIGMLFSGQTGTLLINLALIFYFFAVLFTVVTLPVEFNASNRALRVIRENNILYNEEYTGAKQVLQAAAMTYVASTITALLQFLRLLTIANRRR